METGKILSFEDLPPESLKTESNISNKSRDSLKSSEITVNREETMPRKIFYNEILSKEESEDRINVLLTILSVVLSTFSFALIIIVIALLPKSPKIVQVQTVAKTKQGLLFTNIEITVYQKIWLSSHYQLFSSHWIPCAIHWDSNFRGIILFNNISNTRLQISQEYNKFE